MASVPVRGVPSVANLSRHGGQRQELIPLTEQAEKLEGKDLKFGTNLAESAVLLG